ncbi:hypothetical protein B0H19DRAFT_1236898 [Mycena capillaripes]|nr:hypothetical protein B0H19DRAFT_1236898 [Mycena capillaripes]
MALSALRFPPIRLSLLPILQPRKDKIGRDGRTHPPILHSFVSGLGSRAIVFEGFVVVWGMRTGTVDTVVDQRLGDPNNHLRGTLRMWSKHFCGPVDGLCIGGAIIAQQPTQTRGRNESNNALVQGEVTISADPGRRMERKRTADPLRVLEQVKLAVTWCNIVWAPYMAGLTSVLQDGFSCGPVTIENPHVESNYTLHNISAKQSNPSQAYFGTRTTLTNFDGTSIGSGDGDEERNNGCETHIGLRDVLRRRSVSERPWPGEHKRKQQARNHTSQQINAKESE